MAEGTCLNCEFLAKQNATLRELLVEERLGAARQTHFIADHLGRFDDCESAVCKQFREALEVK